MTPEQITLVRTSWTKINLAPDTLAETFYTRLFELDASVMALFRAGMKGQGVKFVRMIDVAVGALGRLDDLAPVIENLGRRHLEYGVRPEHYDAMGNALLWTLQQGLGREFTADVRDAWGAVYAALAEMMQQAASKQVA